ncbi:MAG: hypothetical protein KKB25_03195 [Nanoarchaeota archaeon]|nr:hypothetical protein [Nanoarchaeota archaeon]
MDILLKLLGVILIAIGFMIVKSFPEIAKYQPEGFSWAGVLIGLIILFAGVALLFL